MRKYEGLWRGADWTFLAAALLLVLGTFVAVAAIRGLKVDDAHASEDANLAMSRERLRAIEYRQNIEKEREAEREGRPVDRGIR
jgi:hypothetical protein